LGLSSERFAQLADRIDTIYHNGADVNFFKPYSQLKATNVLGTQEVLRLACLGRVKPVHYISTISIFGGDSEPRIREDAAIDGHEVGLDLGYSQSKWVAEKLVWSAKSRGLPVTVFRAGAIAGSSQTGVSNLKDFESSFLRGCVQMGAFPDLRHESQLFVPVDYVSQAIVQLSQHPDSIGKAFHLVNPQPISMVEFFEQLAAYGYPLQKLPYPQWRNLLIQQEQRQPTNALNAFLPLYKEEIDQESALSSDRITSSPEFDCQNVLHGLVKTSLSCPSIGQLLEVYLDYFTRNGLLLSPEQPCSR
jgi:thioester reductase-like protein